MMNTGMAPFDDIRAREALTLATPEENYLALIGLGELRAAISGSSPRARTTTPTSS